MSKLIAKINDESEIPEALLSVRNASESFIKDKGQLALLVLAIEELITHISLYNARNMKVFIDGFWNKNIKITAEGDEDFLFSNNDDIRIFSPDNSEEQMVNRTILTQFFYAIKYVREDDRNIYVIYPKKLVETPLSDEIIEFYDEQTKEDKTPWDFVKYLAKKHKITAFTAISTRFIRHLAALLLPYFASNIIQAIIDYGTIFTKVIYLNIAFSLIALSVNLIFVSIENDYYQTFVRKLESGLRLAMVQKVQNLSVKFQNSLPSGVILSKMTSDVMFVKLLFFEFFSLFVIVPEDLSRKRRFSLLAHYGKILSAAI